MIKNIEGLTPEKEFLDILQQKISTCSREVTIAKLDIDNFETVNRFYGEPIGDQVIRKLAHVLANNLPKNALVCRTYKDEFVVLLDATPRDTGALVIEEIRTYFDEHLLLVGEPAKEIGVQFSAGVASFPQNGKTVELLMDAVDRAIKTAKSKGKNQVQTAQNDTWVKKCMMLRREMADELNQLSRRLDKTEAGLFREALQDLIDKYHPSE